MKTGTNYNLGDMVWFMKDNKAMCSKIFRIDITVTYSKEKNRIPFSTDTEVLYQTDDCSNLLQNKIFLAKEDLLKSL